MLSFTMKTLLVQKIRYWHKKKKKLVKFGEKIWKIDFLTSWAMLMYNQPHATAIVTTYNFSLF